MNCIGSSLIVNDNFLAQITYKLLDFIRDLYWKKHYVRNLFFDSYLFDTCYSKMIFDRLLELNTLVRENGRKNHYTIDRERRISILSDIGYTFLYICKYFWTLYFYFKKIKFYFFFYLNVFILLWIIEINFIFPFITNNIMSIFCKL